MKLPLETERQLRRAERILRFARWAQIKTMRERMLAVRPDISERDEAIARQLTAEEIEELAAKIQETYKKSRDSQVSN